MALLQTTKAPEFHKCLQEEFWSGHSTPLCPSFSKVAETITPVHKCVYIHVVGLSLMPGTENLAQQITFSIFLSK